jgi:hypothetical protein
MTTPREKMMVRYRCVACGNVSMQPADPQDPRYVKSWFCGCSPPPVGSALDMITQQITPQKE